MNLLEHAKNNTATTLIKGIAAAEGLAASKLLERIKQGRVVIPANKKHFIERPCGIGEGLLTKINANLGTSTDKSQLKDELKKLEAAVRCGADTVMDLSVGGNLEYIRKEIIKHSPLPVGTVPIYEIAINAQKRKGHFLRFGLDDILQNLEVQAKQGVDFFTIHCGVTRKSLQALKEHPRLIDIVSRGGAILASWMRCHKKENPFYEYFDDILAVAYRYDITLSLGDALRPGTILDSTDSAQIAELKILGELATQARKRNVQVMIEGPGHIPIQHIKKNIALEKKFCNGAPFYVLGPLVTDIAAGYDHISAAIGGALAASYGADFLCFVTPSEHLRHPDVNDVREGVVASKIAAHAADLAKGIPSAIQWDREMSYARKKRDWKKQIALSIYPERAKQLRQSSMPDLPDVCTMCGKYCSMKMVEEYS